MISTCNIRNKDCAYHACNLCSVHLLDDHVHPLLQHGGERHRWENKMVATNGKQVNHKVLVTKREKAADLRVELKTEVAFLARHLSN